LIAWSQITAESAAAAAHSKTLRAVRCQGASAWTLVICPAFWKRAGPLGSLGD